MERTRERAADEVAQVQALEGLGDAECDGQRLRKSQSKPLLPRIPIEHAHHRGAVQPEPSQPESNFAFRDIPVPLPNAHAREGEHRLAQLDGTSEALRATYGGESGRPATVPQVTPARLVAVGSALACFAAGAIVPSASAAPGASKRPALVRLTGEALRSELLDPPGKLRLLHLWASWCVPCRAELPVLARALRVRKRAALDVVLVALDDPEGEAEAGRLLRRAGLARGRLRSASPREAGPHLLHIDPQWDGSVPSSYLLNSRGEVVFAQRGLTVLPELLARIDSELGTQ